MIFVPCVELFEKLCNVDDLLVMRSLFQLQPVDVALRVLADEDDVRSQERVRLGENR